MVFMTRPLNPKCNCGKYSSILKYKIFLLIMLYQYKFIKFIFYGISDQSHSINFLSSANSSTHPTFVADNSYSYYFSISTHILLTFSTSHISKGFKKITSKGELNDLYFTGYYLKIMIPRRNFSQQNGIMLSKHDIIMQFSKADYRENVLVKLCQQPGSFQTSKKTSSYVEHSWKACQTKVCWAIPTRFLNLMYGGRPSNFLSGNEMFSFQECFWFEIEYHCFLTKMSFFILFL